MAAVATNPIEEKPQTKWLILALAGLSNAIAMAVPSMAMSVLFAEISKELNLSLTQVGVVWGIGSVTGIISALLSGSIIDRIGPRKTIIVSVVLAGIAGAMRGLSNSFGFLIFSTLLFGLVGPMVSMSGIKASRVWFPPHQLGSSGGLLSMGMALGFFLSSRFSATLVSPALGGWRNTLMLYGLLAVLLVIPWLFSPKEPELVRIEGGEALPAETSPKAPLFRSLKVVASNPNNWFIAFVLLGLGGSIQAALGYIPLYLRNAGWEAGQADTVLASFHLISMTFTLPLAFLSDRVKSKKRMVMVMMSMIITGLAALAFVEGPLVWAAVLFAGCVRDAFMSTYLAMVINARGITPQLAATATGFAFLFSHVGNIIMPAIGNNIAEAYPSGAFLFWAGCGLLALIGFLFFKE
ncbi:MAG: MFS transporter [Anaerolineae bacterium]|jgi:cyanate permease|nr:MFS transporter [Anaerolineae bacterium]